MKRILFSTFFSLSLCLSLTATALAEQYIINVIVDGKAITLLVNTDGDSPALSSESPGVQAVSIQAVAPVTPVGATAKRNANLRSGPGTTFAVAGSIQTGQVLSVIGRNQASDWLQLADGKWVAAFLVNNAPTGLPVVGGTPPQPLQPAAQPTVTLVPPTPTPAPVVQNCDSSYPDFCIPPGAPDLDCGDIPYRRFRVVGSDPHGFDRDHDGIGCES